MANKNEELKKDQETKNEETKEQGTPETKAGNEGKQEDKNVKEKKPWSTGKKVGVGGGIILGLFGLGCWIKNKFFSGDAEDESPEE